MHLSQAIQKAVNENGVEILKTRRLVALLSDCQAFDNNVVKSTLKQAYEYNFGVRIFNAYSSHDIVQINAVRQSIIDQIGNEQIVTQIFNDFNRAFNLPVIVDNNISGSDYDKIKVVNMKIVNCDSNGREIKKSYFSTKEIRFLSPKINIVNGFDSDRTLDLLIKVNNKGKVYSCPCQITIKSGQNNDLVLKGIGNDSGYFFNAGECRIEIYLAGKILAERGINISKPKSTAQEKKRRNTIIKVVATVIAVLLNIPTYFVSGWWLFLTLPSTLFCSVLFNKKMVSQEWKKWLNYSSLILLFITILTPLPWWLLIIECFCLLLTSTDKPFENNDYDNYDD